jgi:hypothetical protein
MTPLPLGILALAGVTGGGAFDLLETTTLTTGAAPFTITGLDGYADYKHLQIRALLRTNLPGATDAALVNFNNSSGSETQHSLTGNGSSVSSAENNGYYTLRNVIPANTATAGNFAAVVIDFADYNNTSKNTTIRALSGFADGSNNQVGLFSGAWLSTANITEMSFRSGFGYEFVTGCRVSIYGIKGA